MAKAKNIAATPENAKKALAEVEAAARVMPGQHQFVLDTSSGNLCVYFEKRRGQAGYCVLRMVAEQEGRGKPYIALKFKRSGQRYHYKPESLADLRDVVQNQLGEIVAFSDSPMMLRQDIEVR